ncbi:isopentenyl-diphosphate delta-isomerase, partial [Phocaeicola vulgatus]
AGSSGAYFQVADHILQMDRYMPKEITDFAKEESKAFPLVTLPNQKPDSPSFHRVVKPSRTSPKNGRNKIKTLGKDA